MLRQLLSQTAIDPTNAEAQKLLTNMQGNILKSHGREHTRHIFLQFDSSKIGEAKAWISTLEVTSALLQLQDTKVNRETDTETNLIPGEIFINFLLSAKGYQALGAKDTQLPPNKSFQRGMKSEETKKVLSDPSLDKWQPEFQQDIHALVILAGDKEERLDIKLTRLLSEIGSFGRVILVDKGITLRNEAGKSIEHFGYVDGISQPLFLKGMLEKDAQDHGGHDKWDPSASLDLVLQVDPNDSEGVGSYCVYRKLEQNVEGFKHKEEELAKKLHGGSATPAQIEQAGALAVGRFRDGTPVTLFSSPQGAAEAANNFDYGSDQDALKCPFQSHIRKTNPRGDTHRFFQVPLEEEKRHRITRRGIPYGKPTSTESKGLLFICFQSDVANQFEFIQSRWANDGTFVKSNPGVDTLIGQGDSPHTHTWFKTWGDSSPSPATEKLDFSKFVTLRGGEYLFAPSINFLKEIKNKLQSSTAPRPSM